MRIVFAGTPDFAAIHLEALTAFPEVDVVGVYTQPDRRAGRGRKLQPSAVKILAEAHSLPVYQPASLRDTAAESELRTLAPDILIVVAYGLLLPKAILDIPTLGCINVHASMLPRWRGAAPVQRAIEAGDTETGITMMLMDAGLDTGAILLQAPCPIHPTDTSATLFDRLARLGPAQLIAAVTGLSNGTLSPQPQDDSLATYAHKINKTEALINWADSARALDRRIRSFNPAPVCYTMLNGQRLKIWESQAEEGDGIPGQIIQATDGKVVVATGSGALRIDRAQFPGGTAKPVGELLNAHNSMLREGVVLGSAST